MLYFDHVRTLLNSCTCFFVNFAQITEKTAGFDKAKQCPKLFRFSRTNLYKLQIPLKKYSYYSQNQKVIFIEKIVNIKRYD